MIYFFDADNGGGAANDSGKILEGIKNLIDRQGSEAKALEKLYGENFQYRERIRQLEGEVKELETAVPAGDSLVLSADEAAKWQAYKGLGEPEALADQQAQYKGLQRQSLINQVAQAAGYKPSVLDRLAGDIQFELKEEKVDGKPVTAVYVTNGDGKPQPLNDYAQNNWAEFMPALQVTTQDTRLPVARQDAGNTPATTSLVQQELERQYKAQQEKRNPLQVG